MTMVSSSVDRAAQMANTKSNGSNRACLDCFCVPHAVRNTMATDSRGNKKSVSGPKLAYISPTAVALRLVSSPGRYTLARKLVKLGGLWRKMNLGIRDVIDRL